MQDINYCLLKMSFYLYLIEIYMPPYFRIDLNIPENLVSVFFFRIVSLLCPTFMILSCILVDYFLFSHCLPSMLYPISSKRILKKNKPSTKFSMVFFALNNSVAFLCLYLGLEFIGAYFLYPLPIHDHCSIGVIVNTNFVYA